MTKEREETAAQFEARFLKTLQDRTPREACTEAGEPADCPFCGTTPAAAYGAGEPMPMLDAGWLLCPCLGTEWVNVAEEMLRRKSLAERGKDGRYDGWKQVHWEDTQGRFNPDQFTPQSEKAKGRKKLVVNIRQEQEWQGFPGEEDQKVERLEKLDRPVNVRVPAVLVGWLNEKSLHLGQNVSQIMRRLLECHLVDLEEVPRMDKKRNVVRLHFLMTRQHQQLFNGRKKADGCTTAELINAVILREISG